MASKEYYNYWLKSKDQLKNTINEDVRLQQLAKKYIGLKPQGLAVEVVGRIYCKYCDLLNKLCEYYDQMIQPQRQPFLRSIIDTVTCRVLELKVTLENVEAFEFTYPDNALQQMFMIPHDVQILCPFHYPFEIRQEEKQYIVDQIMSGNRLGDPTPTPSELELREEERLEEERRIQEEKDNEIKRKMAMGENISLSEQSVVLSPGELEEMRLKSEFDNYIWAIQRMERCRIVMKRISLKFNKDSNNYLTLAGLKAPEPREDLKIRAAFIIQLVYRNFMKLKRNKVREYKRKEILGMIFPAFSPPSQKIYLEKVREVRRKFRRTYYEKWLQATITEKTRIFRLREGEIMEDISAEIRQWFLEWYNEVRLFDEYPWPEEGGSILVVRGETFTIEEFIEWREAEIKKQKEASSNPKSKEQIKAEKLAELEEKKRLNAEAREKEEKRILDYKKMRRNPDYDPGVYVDISKTVEPLVEAWEKYENQWNQFESKEPTIETIRGYIMQLITEIAYQDINIELRPIIDAMMRLELMLLKKSLKVDCIQAGINKPPMSKRRKRPPPTKNPIPEKLKLEFMFQQLVDAGVVRKYPQTTLDDYWGDKTYAAADLRAIPWTPIFPHSCVGDVVELVRLRCILTLGSNCPSAVRSQLIVGPKSSGKKTLVYAIATETNSILIDLSPMNIYNKFPGGKKLKKMLYYVNRVSRLMQPTIIFVANADKTFYKKVPKEEKKFNPTRLQKDFFKELVRPLSANDKVLIIGTASEPWLAKKPRLKTAFKSVILIPRTDYGSISFFLSKTFLKYHGIDRDFIVQPLAQTLRGYDFRSINKAINMILTADRVARLGPNPLDPMEILETMIQMEDTDYISEEDYEQLFTKWYRSFTPWGVKYDEYMAMLEAQLTYKLKQEKKQE